MKTFVKWAQMGWRIWIEFNIAPDIVSPVITLMLCASLQLSNLSTSTHKQCLDCLCFFFEHFRARNLTIFSSRWYLWSTKKYRHKQSTKNAFMSDYLLVIRVLEKVLSNSNFHTNMFSHSASYVHVCSRDEYFAILTCHVVR